MGSKVRERICSYTKLYYEVHVPTMSDGTHPEWVIGFTRMEGDSPTSHVPGRTPFRFVVPFWLSLFFATGALCSRARVCTAASWCPCSVAHCFCVRVVVRANSSTPCVCRVLCGVVWCVWSLDCSFGVCSDGTVMFNAQRVEYCHPLSKERVVGLVLDLGAGSISVVTPRDGTLHPAFGRGSRVKSKAQRREESAALLSLPLVPCVALLYVSCFHTHTHTCSRHGVIIILA